MTSVATYLAWLEHQVGYRETPINLTKYAAMAGHANGNAWCATFQVAGANETGLALPDGADTASCALNEAAYKRAGRLTTTPRVGAHGFVYFPSLSRVAHTFAVWKVSADGRWVYTVEGNSNDDGAREGYEVCLRKRLAHRATGTVGVRSYGMPLYEEDEMTPAQQKWLSGLFAALTQKIAEMQGEQDEIRRVQTVQGRQLDGIRDATAPKHPTRTTAGILERIEAGVEKLQAAAPR